MPANAGDTGRGFDPWVGKIPLEKEMAPHSTILVWRTQGYRLWGLQSMGLQSMEVAKSRIRLSPHAHITSIKFHSGGVGWGVGVGEANLWAALFHQQSEYSGKAGRQMKFSLMGRRKASFHPLGTEPPIQSLSAGSPAEHEAPFPDKVTHMSGWHLSAPFSSFLADVGRAE